MPVNRTDFRVYAAARGDNAPTLAADATVDAALVRASDYIRTRYVLRLGIASPDTDVNVIEATYIAARREIATPGFWSATFTPSQVKTLIAVEGIRWQAADPGKVGFTGRDLATPMDPAIDALLMPWGFIPGTITV